MSLTANIDRFNLSYLDWRLDNASLDLMDSVAEYGVLVPLTCIEFNNERYIVDGFKRYKAALQHGITAIPYVLISPDISIVGLVMLLQTSELMSSTMLKLRFISAFEWPTDADHLSQLSLPYYSHFKKDLDRLLSLPITAQQFLHDKGFSLKEMVNLLHYAKDAFHRLLADDCYFQFTKRSFDEVLSLITALMKRLSLSLDQLIEKTNYLAIIAKDLTPQQRQKQWLMNLKQDASPVLLASQQKIDRMIADISLPATIGYDRTLEHAGITIQSKIQTPSDLTELTTALSDDTIRHQLNDVMGLI